MVKLTINGSAVEAQEGTTVLRAAETAGIVIPTLCDHPNLTPYGGCRLCVVEVKGARFPAPSCTLPVSEGLVIQTETRALKASRRAILSMLLSAYYDDGYTKNDHPDNQLIYWARRYGVPFKQAAAKTPRYPINSDPNPFIRVDFNKCILCMRCVRACAEIQGRFVWSQAGRGYDTHIVAGADTDLLSARCESCGACVAYCPTGALDNKMSAGLGLPEKVVTTTCTYCGVGCQLDLNVKTIQGREQIIRVTSNPKAPVNGMHLCVKGRYGYDFVHHPDRLTSPMVREYLLAGKSRADLPTGDRGAWVKVDWNTALDITARKLNHARDTYGPDSVGLLTSAKCLNEENYLMNKFARQVIGTNTIDHCARL